MQFDSIINHFPKFKLSYEKFIYKKVTSYDYCIAIPKGKKYFAWFTYYNDQNICIFLHVNRNEILNIEYFPVCFNNELSLGTILYGTIIKHKNNNFFCIENIYYYCNQYVNNYLFKNKLKLYEELFKNIKNIYFNKINFTLAIIKQKEDILINELIKISYPIYCIKYISQNEIINYIIKEAILPKIAVFIVKPNIQNDIYSLYCNNNKDELVFYNICDVPSYKTSVFLNNSFRNIKENRNLDLLEESDSDDDFENINEDKYIKHKELKMKCIYNNNTKKWYPIENINNTNDSISNINSL